MNKRLFPLSKEFFKEEIEPLIVRHYKRPGRPPENDHYTFFCSILYVLRAGIPWRDMPKEFGPWHTLYTRFKRWSENGLFWFLVRTLQQKKKVSVDFTWIDSTTVGVHRHGSGAFKKKGHNPLVEGAKA